MRGAPSRTMGRMSPLDLFHEARLSDAVCEQRRIVLERPDDIAERLLFCDLLAFTGGAAVGEQLDELRQKPDSLQAYIAEYRSLLPHDAARHSGDRPHILLEPTDDVLRRLDAADCLKAGRLDEAIDLLDAADDLTPWVDGFVDGRPFDGWRDSDDLLGPILEVFQGDRYAWLPVAGIRKLRLEKSESLRDCLYRPATIWLADGQSLEVFIPTLYMGTAEHPEEGIRTGAGIDWVERDGLMRGLGSRTLLFGDEELNLSEFRQVEVRAL